MTNGTRLDGYGSSIQFDGLTVRLIAGKLEAKIWRTDFAEFPVTDIEAIAYRGANPMVNGSMSFKTARPANDYANPRTDGEKWFVPNNALGIKWRRKDQAAFAALHSVLQAQLPTEGYRNGE